MNNNKITNLRVPAPQRTDHNNQNSNFSAVNSGKNKGKIKNFPATTTISSSKKKDVGVVDKVEILTEKANASVKRYKNIIKTAYAVKNIMEENGTQLITGTYLTGMGVGQFFLGNWLSAAFNITLGAKNLYDVLADHFNCPDLKNILEIVESNVTEMGNLAKENKESCKVIDNHLEQVGSNVKNLKETAERNIGKLALVLEKIGEKSGSAREGLVSSKDQAAKLYNESEKLYSEARENLENAKKGLSSAIAASQGFAGDVQTCFKALDVAVKRLVAMKSCSSEEELEKVFACFFSMELKVKNFEKLSSITGGKIEQFKQFLEKKHGPGSIKFKKEDVLEYLMQQYFERVNGCAKQNELQVEKIKAAYSLLAEGVSKLDRAHNLRSQANEVVSGAINIATKELEIIELRTYFKNEKAQAQAEQRELIVENEKKVQALREEIAQKALDSEKKLKILRNELVEKSKEIEECSENAKELRQQLEVKQKKILQGEEEFNKAKEELSAQMNNLKEKSKELKEKEIEISKLSSKLGKRDEKIKNLIKELAEVENRCQKDLKQARKELKKMEARCEEQIKLVEETKAKLAKLKNMIRNLFSPFQVVCIVATAVALTALVGPFVGLAGAAAVGIGMKFTPPLIKVVVNIFFKPSEGYATKTETVVEGLANVEYTPKSLLERAFNKPSKSRGNLVVNLGDREVAVPVKKKKGQIKLELAQRQRLLHEIAQEEGRTKIIKDLQEKGIFTKNPEEGLLRFYLNEGRSTSQLAFA